MWYNKNSSHYDDDWCPSIIITKHCDHERHEYIKELTKELEKHFDKILEQDDE